MGFQKSWLDSFSWEQVQGLNQSLCKKHETNYEANQSCEQARRFWESFRSRNGASSQQMSLLEVLGVCRKCFEMSPFTFNNGNTFAAIGTTLVEDWLASLPALDGQIVRNTISHFVAGVISKKELLAVLRHFEASLNGYASARQVLSDEPRASMPDFQSVTDPSSRENSSADPSGLAGSRQRA